MSSRTERRAAHDDQELIDLEYRGWDALSSPNGAGFYADLMTDDAVMVFPGTVMTKRESLAAIAAARPWATYRLEDVRVLRAGGSGRIVLYRAIAKRAVGTEYDALMSSLYVRRSDGWRLVLHQQTPRG